MAHGWPCSPPPLHNPSQPHQNPPSWLVSHAGVIEGLPQGRCFSIVLQNSQIHQEKDATHSHGEIGLRRLFASVPRSRSCPMQSPKYSLQPRLEVVGGNGGRGVGVGGASEHGACGGVSGSLWWGGVYSNWAVQGPKVGSPTPQRGANLISVAGL